MISYSRELIHELLLSLLHELLPCTRLREEEEQ
jgi:hypothetical protein